MPREREVETLDKLPILAVSHSRPQGGRRLAGAIEHGQLDHRVAVDSERRVRVRMPRPAPQFLAVHVEHQAHPAAHVDRAHGRRRVGGRGFDQRVVIHARSIAPSRDTTRIPISVGDRPSEYSAEEAALSALDRDLPHRLLGRLSLATAHRIVTEVWGAVE